MSSVIRSMANLENVHYVEKALHAAITQDAIDDIINDGDFGDFEDDPKIVRELEKKEQQGFTV